MSSPVATVRDHTTLPAPQRAPLRVSQPDEPLEKEAEEVAGRVMRMPSGEVGLMQRCPGGCPDEEMLRRQVDDEGEEDVLAQRIPKNWKDTAAPPEVTSAIQARRGGGSPLPLSTRRFFEAPFGADLSKVRVHHESAAARLAASVHARAFTVGHDLFFGPGSGPRERSGAID